MRLVHTADWHVGRLWKNISRLDESARVLDHLAGFLERERIELLLLAGDVFDTPNPGADAEQLVFQFFRRLGAARIPAVVIAGNHDHAGRMEAYAQLAELAGVHVVGRPRQAARGGVVEIATTSGVTALVAALPFAGPGPLRTALELPDTEGPKLRYADIFQGAVARLAGVFRPGCVNLFMAHTHLAGALFANSERLIHLTDDWAARPEDLPATAHYVALGHVHRPQRLAAAPAPAEYAGTPLQLDFGEAGQAKSFVVVDVEPGRAARIEHIPYEGGQELLDLRLPLPELAARTEELRLAGWLRLTVPLAEPDPDLGAKVRSELPNALVIRPELPCVPAEPPLPSVSRTPSALYRTYYQRQHERPPEASVEAAFQQLYEDCSQDHGD